jgi:hypothetical protein
LTPLTSIPLGPTNGLPVAVLVGDFFTSSPVADLATIMWADVPGTGSTLRVYAGNGNGTYQPTPRVTHVAGFVNDIAAGDLNRDGLLDLVVAAGGPQVLLSTGDGSFTVLPPLVAPISADSIAVADFNGDGRTDVLGPGRNGLSVFLGNGDGTLRSPLPSASSFAGRSVVTTDFNHDDRVDIALATLSGASVALGNGDGTFQSPRTLTVPLQGFEEVISVAVGDLNGDTHVDLVTGSTGIGRVNVLLGNGDGGFAAAVPYGTPLDGDFWSGANARMVALGNINGDSLPDVIVADSSANASRGLSVLVGLGGGALQAPVAFGMRNSENILVRDLTDDSLDDVVAATFGGQTFQAQIMVNTCSALGLRSLAFNGTTGYADAAHAADLNPSGDWTIETWFKDEDPRGFDHDYVTLLNKGDRGSSGASPYVISLGYKRLQVGQRSGWVDYSLPIDLRALGIDANQWHHVAASFVSSTRQLTVYLDGQRVAQGTLGVSTVANTLPLQLGRNGPTAGRYFLGKLDDVRIWRIARTANDISASFSTQLASAPTGLIANWKLDEAAGTLLVDSAGGHPATLRPGAALLTDSHPT